MAVTQSIADPNNPGRHGTEAQINEVNYWMRQQPWYRALLDQWGQNDQTGVKLSKAQRDQLMGLARQNGIDVTNDTEIDPAGNLNPKGHKLRNTLIIAGLAAATLATAGAAGAFGGSALAGSAGAGAGGAAAAGAGAAGVAGGAAAGGSLAGLGATGWLSVAGMGANAVSQWYQQRQADKAAGRQVDQSREALALEKEMFDKEQARQAELDIEDKRRYEQDRTDTLGRDEEKRRVGERDYADLSPYRSIGMGALDRLAFGVGIPGRPSESRPTTPTVSANQAMIDAKGMAISAAPMGGGTLSGLGTPAAANVSQGGMTTMRTPTGQIVMVPAAKVQEAVANGGTVLSQGAA